jgi:hypothetical protein
LSPADFLRLFSCSHAHLLYLFGRIMAKQVGATGFEPATPWSQTDRQEPQKTPFSPAFSAFYTLFWLLQVVKFDAKKCEEKRYF